MDQAKIATLTAGVRPLDLTPERRARLMWQPRCWAAACYLVPPTGAARDLLGQGALNELVLWIGTYAQVAITLNAFDVPSEEVFD